MTIALQAKNGAKLPDSWQVTFAPFGNPPNRALRIQSVTAVCGAFLPRQLAGVPQLEVGEMPTITAPQLPEIAIPKL